MKNFAFLCFTLLAALVAIFRVYGQTVPPPPQAPPAVVAPRTNVFEGVSPEERQQLTILLKDIQISMTRRALLAAQYELAVAAAKKIEQDHSTEQARLNGLTKALYDKTKVDPSKNTIDAETGEIKKKE